MKPEQILNVHFSSNMIPVLGSDWNPTKYKDSQKDMDIFNKG